MVAISDLDLFNVHAGVRKRLGWAPPPAVDNPPPRTIRGVQTHLGVSHGARGLPGCTGGRQVPRIAPHGRAEAHNSTLVLVAAAAPSCDGRALQPSNTKPAHPGPPQGSQERQGRPWVRGPRWNGQVGPGRGALP